MGAFEIITLIFSMLELVGSAVFQGMANKQNRDIAQANIDQANEAREDSQQFAREQAATANAATWGMYQLMDSPTAKLKQLKAAGLSPGLMYGGGGMGGGAHTAAMAGTPSAQPGITAPFINPLLSFSSNPSDAMKKAAEAEGEKIGNQKTEEEIKNLAEARENMRKERERMDRDIAWLESKTQTEALTQQEKEVDIALKKINEKWADLDWQGKIGQINDMRELIQQQKQKAEQEVIALKAENKYIDEMKELAVKQAKAQLVNLMNDTLLKQAQTAKEWAQRSLAEAQADVANEQRTALAQQWRKTIKECEKIEKEINKITIESAKMSYDLMNSQFTNFTTLLESMIPG